MIQSILKDIKSVSDFKKHTREVFEHLHNTGHPVILTVNGKPDAVLLDAVVFEEKLKALNLSLLLAEAEEDIQKKRTRPARLYLQELRRRAKISR